MYSELVYFDGAHFAHIVAFMERLRLRNIMERDIPRHVGWPANRRMVQYSRFHGDSATHRLG